MNITIIAIAERAGVSAAAVSMVLNGYPYIGKETKDRILKIAAQFIYTPNAKARNLVKKMATFRTMSVQRDSPA